MSETDEKVCLRLLWVFRQATLPELHPKIWALADSSTEDVRAAAAAALSRISDEKIGEFGRAKLRSSSFSEGDVDVLSTLVRNYQPHDEELIVTALRRLSPNDDNAHSFSLRILEIAGENDLLDARKLMEWVYETTPCTVCRKKAVELMINDESIAFDVVLECLHDANDEIRQIAKQYCPV